MVHHGLAHLQELRIEKLCREANPECRVQFEHCDIGSVKPIFLVPGSRAIYVPYTLSAQYLADKSDDDLWEWIGQVTGGSVTLKSS